MEHFQKLHNRRLRAIIALMTAIALFFTVLLYLATIAGRGFTAQDAVKVMVRGEYTVS